MVQVAVDIALAWLVVEGVVLLVLVQTRRLSLPPRAFATLGAGFCLLLALRMSVAEAASVLILPILALAGACHIVEMSSLLGRTGAPRVALGACPDPMSLLRNIDSEVDTVRRARTCSNK